MKQICIGLVAYVLSQGAQAAQICRAQVDPSACNSGTIELIMATENYLTKQQFILNIGDVRCWFTDFGLVGTVIEEPSGLMKLYQGGLVVGTLDGDMLTVRPVTEMGFSSAKKYEVQCNSI